MEIPEIFESLKTLEQDYGLSKKDFPPVWSPFTLYGKDNPLYGIGCPAENFMRTEQFKKKMSESIKQTFKNGRVHGMTGAVPSKLQRQRTAEANSNTVTLKFKDGSEKTINNLRQWCKKNGHSDIALYKGLRERGYYKDIIGLIKSPK